METRERHRYCVTTSNDMVLKNIQLNNSALSIIELEDFAGEDGKWVKTPEDLGRTRHCSRCWGVDKRPAKYCRYCGSRNMEVYE